MSCVRCHQFLARYCDVSNTVVSKFWRVGAFTLYLNKIRRCIIVGGKDSGTTVMYTRNFESRNVITLTCKKKKKKKQHEPGYVSACRTEKKKNNNNKLFPSTSRNPNWSQCFIDSLCADFYVYDIITGIMMVIDFKFNVAYAVSIGFGGKKIISTLSPMTSCDYDIVIIITAGRQSIIFVRWTFSEVKIS